MTRFHAVQRLSLREIKRIDGYMPINHLANVRIVDTIMPREKIRGGKRK